MTWLIIGMCLFFGGHVLPMMPGLKSALVARTTERGFQALVAVAAFAGLGLMVFGYSRAGFEPVYPPPAWGMAASQLLMLPVFLLLIAAYRPSNVKRITRHPMLWATVLWALAHLAANGDAASLVLFGGFAVWAPLAMLSANRRGARLGTDPVPVVSDVLNLVAGLVAYALVGYFHASIFGVASGLL